MKKVRLLNKIPGVAGVMAAACVSAMAGDPGVIYSDDFAKDSGKWESNRYVVENGAISVGVGQDGQNNGNLLFLNKPFTIQDGKALELKFQVKGFANVSGNGQEADCSARIFVIPDPLPKFIEPYVSPNLMWIFIESRPGGDLAITLYKKNQEPEDGYGVALYRGSLSPQELPLTVTLRFDTGRYFLSFDKDVITDAGSLSGLIDLPKDLWAGDLHFGVRIVNGADGVDSRVTLGGLEIANVTLQD